MANKRREIQEFGKLVSFSDHEDSEEGETQHVFQERDFDEADDDVPVDAERGGGKREVKRMKLKMKMKKNKKKYTTMERKKNKTTDETDEEVEEDNSEEEEDDEDANIFNLQRTTVEEINKRKDEPKLKFKIKSNKVDITLHADKKHVLQKATNTLKSKILRDSIHDNKELQMMQTFADVLDTTRTTANAKQKQTNYLVHALHHAYSIRDKILKNNTKLQAVTKKSEEDNATSSKTRKGSKIQAVNRDIAKLDLQDQGYTRPSTLILLPTRADACTLVQSLIEIYGGKMINQKERFFEEYGPEPPNPRTNNHYFEGNTNDDFVLGIKLTRKLLRLFSRRSDSDIIIASPLSLRVMFENSKPAFLSSITLLIVDPAEHILMQNPAHLDFLMGEMTQVPKHPPPETDFSRVRAAFLDGLGSYIRQNIWISSCMFPELNSWSRNSNIQGMYKIAADDPGTVDALSEGSYSFENFVAEDVASMDDCRFSYFEDKVLGRFLAGGDYSMHQTLIYAASYFDYLRLRTLLKETLPDDYLAICEYTSGPEMANSRRAFTMKERRILLMSGRMWFHKRYRIRGTERVFFYTPPVIPFEYTEICGMAEGDRRALVCRYDASKIIALTGSKEAVSKAEGEIVTIVVE